MHERSSRFYCERCSDTGMVSVDRIGAQPEALRCGCYRVNPVIQARHDRFGRKKKPKGGAAWVLLAGRTLYGRKAAQPAKYLRCSQGGG